MRGVVSQPSLDKIDIEESYFSKSSLFFGKKFISVRQEISLSYWKQFYVSLDKSVRQEMVLYSWKQFYASLDESVQQGMFLVT